MKRLIALLALVAVALSAEAQNELKFGKVTKADLQKTDYPIAAGADVVVLDEYIQNGFYYQFYVMPARGTRVVCQHRVARRIKILSDKGLEQLKFDIQLEKDNAGRVSIAEFSAQRYSLENNKVTRKAYPNNDIVIENNGEFAAVAKIDLSDAKVGDIIEYRYMTFKKQAEQIISTDIGHIAPTINATYEAVVFNGNEIPLTAVKYGDAEITQTRNEDGRLIYYTSFGDPSANEVSYGAIYNYSRIPVNSGNGTNRACMVYSFHANNIPANTEPSGVKVIIPNDGIESIRQK